MEAFYRTQVSHDPIANASTRSLRSARLAWLCADGHVGIYTSDGYRTTPRT
jgi:hypothetical protein